MISSTETHFKIDGVTLATVHKESGNVLSVFISGGGIAGTNFSPQEARLLAQFILHELDGVEFDFLGHYLPK